MDLDRVAVGRVVSGDLAGEEVRVSRAPDGWTFEYATDDPERSTDSFYTDFSDVPYVFGDGHLICEWNWLEPHFAGELCREAWRELVGLRPEPSGTGAGDRVEGTRVATSHVRIRLTSGDCLVIGMGERAQFASVEGCGASVDDGRTPSYRRVPVVELVALLEERGEVPDWSAVDAETASTLCSVLWWTSNVGQAKRASRWQWRRPS